MSGEFTPFHETAWGIMGLITLLVWLGMLAAPILGFYLFCRLVRALESIAVAIRSGNDQG